MTRGCPYDGFGIPDPGSSVIDGAAFPSDCELYASYVISAKDNYECPQCGTEIPDIYKVYLFIFTPSTTIFIYFPKGIDQEIVFSCEKGLNEKLGSEFKVESSDNLKIVRYKAFEAVLNLVDIHSLSSVASLIGKDDIELLSPTGLRDKAYHAALYLVTSRSKGFIAPIYLPEPITVDGSWQILGRARYKQTAISFFDLVDQLVKSENNFDPMSEIEKLFIPESFDDSVLSYIGKIVSNATHKSKVYYIIIDSLLAAAAVYSGHENPRKVQWILQLIKMTYREKNWPSRLQISKETLKKMASVPELLEGLAKVGLLQSSDSLRSTFDIIERLGYQKGSITPFLKMDIAPDKEGIPPETFIKNIITRVQEKGADDQYLGHVLNLNIANIDNEQYKIRCFDLILEKFAKSRPQVIIPLVQALTKQMSGDRNPDVLVLISKVQKEINIDKLALGPKVMFLTEVGNAFRYAFHYSEAISIYEEIKLLIGNDLREYDVRVNEANIARVLRDMGRLTDAKKILVDVIKYAEEEKQRFDCLFALGTIHQKNGEFDTAQRVFDEARLLIRHLPIDDQIVAFYYTLVKNQQELGLHPDFRLLAEVTDSPFVSNRSKDIATATLVSAVFSEFSSDFGDQEDVKKLREDVLEELMNNSIIIELVKRYTVHDPHLATIWCDALISAGKDKLAKEVLDLLLYRQKEDHTLTMYAATKAAELAAKKKDWQEVSQNIITANKEMVELVKSAGVGETTIHSVDTMISVRNLARLLLDIPRQTTTDEEINEIISSVTDLQCSLRLSTDLAPQYLPVSKDTDTLSPAIWAESLRKMIKQPIQILQFLDVTDNQIPILLQLYKDKLVVNRGAPIPTQTSSQLGKDIENRIKAMPANCMDDPFNDIQGYVGFKDKFLSIMKHLELDRDMSLLVVPSWAVLGIPFHHILSDQPIAYVPSISIALALSGRAEKELFYPPSTIGEVISWKFNENAKLVKYMNDGGIELKEICNHLSVEYQPESGINASKSNVLKLIRKAPWIKLNCHGLAKSDYGKFAIVLSDGNQDPPKLDNLLTNEELSSRYLLHWEEMAEAQGSCRLIFSTACASGSSSSTLGGEQIGMARAFFRSGLLSYIAPIWPVGGKGSQIFINTLINSCLSNPDIPLTNHILNVRKTLHNQIPDWTSYAFVLHGYYGPVRRNS